MLNCAAVIKYHLLELQKVLNLRNFFFLFSSLVFSVLFEDYLNAFVRLGSTCAASRGNVGNDVGDDSNGIL